MGVRSAVEPDDSRALPSDPILCAVLEAAEASDSVETAAHKTGRSIAETRAALGRLEAEGYLVRADLGGWERAAR